MLKGKPPSVRPESVQTLSTPRKATIHPLPLIAHPVPLTDVMIPKNELKIIEAVERKAPSSTLPPRFMTCDPQGAPEKRLHQHLSEIEPILRRLAGMHGDIDIVAVNIDKSRQNPVNMLGGRDAAGDAAMETHWRIIDRAASILEATCGEIVKLDLIRVSPTSDEGIILIAGRNLPKDIGTRFDKAMKEATAEIRLKDVKYSLQLEGGDTYESDLDGFSTILRHPEMVVSSKYTVSAPHRISPDEKEGFIHELIRQEENREAPFFNRLPKIFRVNDNGLPEVLSPFSTNLTREISKRLNDGIFSGGIERLQSGCFIEIKLRAPDAVARKLLRYTVDGPGWTGTRKGYNEIFSGRFGMRGFNTFIGKARNNSVLTPISQAMGDVESLFDVTVMPVNGGYLQYYVEMEPNEATRAIILEALVRRIHSSVENDPGYASFGFEPEILMLDASTVTVQNVRARFILDSLGKRTFPVEVLERSDFLINFLENVDPDVQGDFFKHMLANGMINPSDSEMIQKIRDICDYRRTIRDTEDLIMVIRNDTSLHPEILSKNKRGSLQQWFFDFSFRNGNRMFRQLAMKVDANIGKRESMESMC